MLFSSVPPGQARQKGLSDITIDYRKSTKKVQEYIKIFIVVFLIQQQHAFRLRIVTIPTKGSIEIELNNSILQPIIAAYITKARGSNPSNIIILLPIIQL